MGRLGIETIGFALFVPLVNCCSRAVYEDDAGGVYTGRSMDWAEDLGTNLWSFPRGMDRRGRERNNAKEWTSRYGSVIASCKYGATVDGMNEAGLGVNVLYLAEADYGWEKRVGQKEMSIGAVAQYMLDMFGSVREAVAAMSEDNLRIWAPMLPNGQRSSVHFSLSDGSSDSAILEYLDGLLVIHHGSQYKVMTNSPTFDHQLSLVEYWNEIGGVAFLPGTHRPADRFARLSWNLNATPKVTDNRTAVAATYSLMRHVSVPLGIADPEKPNIATTLYRTVIHHNALRYHYDDAQSPNVFWVDVANLDLSETAKPAVLNMTSRPIMAGDVSGFFVASDPFPWVDVASDEQLL